MLLALTMCTFQPYGRRLRSEEVSGSGNFEREFLKKGLGWSLWVSSGSLSECPRRNLCVDCLQRHPDNELAFAISLHTFTAFRFHALRATTPDTRQGFAHNNIYQRIKYRRPRSFALYCRRCSQSNGAKTPSESKHPILRYARRLHIPTSTVSLTTTPKMISSLQFLGRLPHEIMVDVPRT